jgi:hypothetical protein
MGRSIVFWAMMGGWAGLTVLSVAAPLLMGPDGTGVGPGMNRVTLFLMYQAGATTLAALLLLMATGQPTAGRRWLARTPALVVLGQLVLLGAVILWGRLGAAAA